MTCAGTWADQIDAACERGGGPLRCLDLLRMLREGRARMFISENMHGSCILTHDRVEIFHVWGRWVLSEAKWMLEQLQAFGRYHGYSMGRAMGRGGWQRFLRMQGLKLEG